MKLYEIGTGYTPIPAQIGAATEIVVEELTKSFIKKELCVELIDIRADNRPANRLPITEVGVPKIFMGTDVHLGMMHKLKRVIYSISLVNKLKGILKNSEKKVILHFHNQYNLYFFYRLVPRRLQEKACIVYTNHSYIWHGTWDDIKKTVQKRYFQEVYCLEHADHIFVLNEQTKNNITEHLQVDPCCVHLIGNGVNVDVYAPYDAKQKREIKRKWNLEGKKIFIQVGSVCERKNQMTTLKILLPFLQQDKDLVFCYAGGIIDPEYQSAIVQLAKDQAVSEQVIYAGELQPGNQLNEFYNLAEAMVFPSTAEGFSLVIIEAMSAGVPVLVSKELQFELADQCIRCGVNEFYTAIRDQILEDNSQNDLSARARQAVLDAYSWDKIAGDYLDVWNRDIN